MLLRHFLLLLFTFSCALVGAPQVSVPPAPPWVSLAAGKLSYHTDEKGNRIPDFSMVGYETGLNAPPNIPAVATLRPGSGDQTAAIQQALDALAKRPVGPGGFRGALVLQQGEYQVSGGLVIRASGVVLRGEGIDPKSGTVIRDTGKDKDPLISIVGAGKPALEAKPRTVTDAIVPVGAREVKLDSVEGLKIGDTVMLTRGVSDAWTKFIQADRPGVDWPTKFPLLRWDRVVTGISGNKVQLDAPVTTALEAQFGGATLAKYVWPERIDHCGVENLMTISNHTKPDDEDHSWVAVSVSNAQHVFVRNVVAQHFAYAAVHLTPTAKWATVSECQCLDPVSVITGARRYSFCVDGQLCLVRQCFARKGRHDFVANNYGVTGPNVFVDCKAESSYSESGPHRHWTSGMLWDNVSFSDRLSLYHRKNYGRKESKPPYHLGHGWAAANCVAWNCTIAKLLLVESPPGAHNWAIGCKAGSFSSSGPERGVKKGAGEFESNNQPVPIRSLYAAQLEERRKLAK